MRASQIRVAVLLILLAVVALLSLVPKTVVAADGPGDIRCWGLVEDPSGKPHNVLVLLTHQLARFGDILSTASLEVPCISASLQN